MRIAESSRLSRGQLQVQAEHQAPCEPALRHGILAQDSRFEWLKKDWFSFIRLCKFQNVKIKLESVIKIEIVSCNETKSQFILFH